MNISPRSTNATRVRYKDSSISNSPPPDVIFNNNKSTIEKSNLIPFPKEYPAKDSNNIEESGIQIKKITNTTVKEADQSYDDLIGYLQKAVEITETLSSVKKYSNLGSAGNDYYEEKLKIKEAEAMVFKVQSKFNLFKYYSLIWILSALLLGFFSIMLVTGLLSIFSSISGIIATIVGIGGTYLDWKDRESKYDS